MLIRIESPYYCAGAIIKDGVCIKAAPILRWMVGKPLEVIQSYAEFKGFEFSYIEMEE